MRRSATQVIVYTDYPGQAPEVAEDQVTYPMTTAMLYVIQAARARSRAGSGLSGLSVRNSQSPRPSVLQNHQLF
jgi:Cu/Ag efflux pump CusA